ncbi:MAG: Rieske (2Fe-2S) protein, partial [Vicinamibacterales bacterium]
MSTTSPRGLKNTLPARAYTDAEWFGLEMDRVFARMWVAAGRATQLPRAGAFIRRDVAGASVLIVRGAEGAIRAFYNVCRHRGTRLCTENEGWFRGSIQCPYHAWTYALDGHLVAAPQMDEVAGFDRGDYPLREVACEVWDGHIFVNLSDPPTPLAA